MLQQGLAGCDVSTLLKIVLFMVHQGKIGFIILMYRNGWSSKGSLAHIAEAV